MGNDPFKTQYESDFGEVEFIQGPNVEDYMIVLFAQNHLGN